MIKSDKNGANIGGTMRKNRCSGRMLPLLCGGFCFVLLLLGHGPAKAQETPITRALLIACERFVIQDDLYPAASASVTSLYRALGKNGNALQSVYTEIGTIGTQYQLRQAIQNAFADATEDDVSLFYIATHGNFRSDYPDAQPTLSLSDGKTETNFAGAKLQEMLSAIPGTKLVFIDACNSGAMIGKGVNLARQPGIATTGPIDTSIKVLTSASGNEQSWYYGEHLADNTARRTGDSYFGAALAKGLGLNGVYYADLNRDGQITLDELYRYMLQNQSVSTVQVYPQEDDFVILTYDTSVPQIDSSSVTDVAFSNESIYVQQPQLTFSFTVRREVQIEYHITYQRDGVWDWANTRRFMDTFDGQAEGGALSPGRKQRSIQMQAVEADSAGYALFQMMALDEDGPSVLCSRLISVLPSTGDPELTLQVPNTSFVYWEGQELPIYVQHAFPLRLSLNLYDLNGTLRRRIVENQLTRPLQLEPAGSVYFWDGKDQYGNALPGGVYTVVASAQVGDTLYQTQPMLFQLIVPMQ